MQFSGITFSFFTSRVVVWFIYVFGSIVVVPEWDVNKHRLQSPPPPPHNTTALLLLLVYNFLRLHRNPPPPIHVHLGWRDTSNVTSCPRSRSRTYKLQVHRSTHVSKIKSTTNQVTTEKIYSHLLINLLVKYMH